MPIKLYHVSEEELKEKEIMIIENWNKDPYQFIKNFHSYECKDGLCSCKEDVEKLIRYCFAIISL